MDVIVLLSTTIFENMKHIVVNIWKCHQLWVLFWREQALLLDRTLAYIFKISPYIGSISGKKIEQLWKDEDVCMVIKFNRNYVCSINVDCLIVLCCFTCHSTCTQRRASGRLWWTLMEVKAASCDQTGASLSDVAHLLNTRVFCPPVLLVIDSIHVMSDRRLYNC